MRLKVGFMSYHSLSKASLQVLIFFLPKPSLLDITSSHPTVLMASLNTTVHPCSSQIRYTDLNECCRKQLRHSGSRTIPYFLLLS